MQFGVSTFVTDEGIGPAALGRALEERGFAALFVAEHTHIPVSRATPYPAGGDLPRVYYRTLDPIVTLTAVAGATENLRLGTGIALIPQRDPIVLAKEFASLDLISGGRTVLGIGAGWNREEMADHGTDPRTRMALMRERVLAMKEIWSKDEAEFHGEFVDFDPMFSWPKPIRVPPVLLGGAAPKAFERVLDYGDGWLPIVGRGGPQLSRQISELREQAGRHVPVTAHSAVPRPEVVAGLIESGVDAILFNLPTESAGDTLRRLDEMATLIA